VEYGPAAEAEAVSRRSVAILATTHKDDDWKLINARLRLAMVLDRAGKPDEAKPLYEGLLQTLARTAGENDFAYFQCLRKFAQNRHQAGDEQAADALTSKLLGLFRQVAIRDDPEYARDLAHTAAFLLQRKKAADAIALAKQSLQIQGRVLPPQHPNQTETHKLLAKAYRALGNHQAMLPHLRAVVDDMRATHGADAVEYAHALFELGKTLDELDKLNEAASRFKEALAILRKVKGEHATEVVNVLNALAVVAAGKLDFEWAEKLMVEALDIEQKTGALDHTCAGTLLHNLAAIRLRIGKSASAIEMLTRSADVVRKKFGHASTEYLSLLTALGEAHLVLGDYVEAEAQLMQALQLCESGRLYTSPERQRVLEALGLVRAAAGRPAEALHPLGEASAIQDHLLTQIISTATERERLHSLKRMHGKASFFLTLVCVHLPDSADGVRMAWELVSRRKGLAVAAMQVQRAAPPGDSMQTTPSELASLRQQLAELQMVGPPVDSDSRERYRHQLRQIQAHIDNVEERGAKATLAFLSDLQGLTPVAVSAALPNGAAFVEFAKFRKVSFALHEREQAPTECWRYVAFVIVPSGGGPHLIDLGSADPIDTHISAMQASAVKAVRRGERDLGAPDSETPEASLDSFNTLYDLVVAPVLARVPVGTERLFVVPDGELGQLPLGVLVDSQGMGLLEAFALCYLSSARDLLHSSPGSGTKFPAVVVGAPDFELSQTANEPLSGPDEPAGLDVSEELDPMQACRQAADLPRGHKQFTPLPGTRIEADLVGAVLGVTPWAGPAALKGRLQRVRAPCILHIATHGFFLENKWAAWLDDQGLTFEIAAEHIIGGRLASLRLESPLLRSGLALAGANVWLRFESPPREAGDGLLTAEDVAGMDLHGTDLVVLSACETALGDIRVGDGVIGLQRAFFIAGARTLVMSLWKVPDLATCLLIHRFYQNLLARQQRCDQALREAQHYLRNLTIADIKQSSTLDASLRALIELLLPPLSHHPDTVHPFLHPAYWGGFICIGNPASFPSPV
jgi:CHAT domain-containing protein/tetratricopeptide (TPR) repeat protein